MSVFDGLDFGQQDLFAASQDNSQPAGAVDPPLNKGIIDFRCRRDKKRKGRRLGLSLLRIIHVAAVQ